MFNILTSIVEKSIKIEHFDFNRGKSVKKSKNSRQGGRFKMLNFEIESSTKILVDQLVSLGAAAAGDTRIAA